MHFGQVIAVNSSGRHGLIAFEQLVPVAVNLVKLKYGNCDSVQEIVFNRAIKGVNDKQLSSAR